MKKISNILLLIKRAWRVSKIMFLVYFIKLCLDLTFPFVGITYSTLIITALTENRDSNVILSYIVQMVLISLAIKLLLNIILLINIDLQNKTNNQAGADLLKEYMEIDYKFSESGDMQNLRQSFFLYILPAEFLPVLGRLFTGIFTVFGCFYIVLEIHPLMLIVILLFIFIKILAVKKQNKIDYEWSIEKIPAQKKLNYLSYVMTSYDFSKEIRINGGQDWVKNKFKGILSLYDISLCKVCNKKIKPSLLITIIDIMQQLIVYMYLSFRVIGNTLSIGAFNMLLQVISLFYSSINAVFDNILYLSKTSDYVEKYKEYNELVKAAETAGTESIEQIDDVEIEFKNVTMIYPDSDKVVLKDISFKVNAKENIAIVGLNGAGKSTIIKLICRLYTPTAGEILINGKNIQSYRFDEYTSLFSVVLQDFKLLSFSVKENIILDRDFDEKKYEKSIEASNLKDKIDSLPNKSETTMYKQFDENGIEFSGGEAQRVSLAREIYKDGKVFLLDEPSSAMDAIAESELFESLNRTVADKTAIYISHRLSSVIFCNRIMVLNNGEIKEIGTHNELMKNKGEYYEMYSKQAQSYQVAKGGDDNA